MNKIAFRLLLLCIPYLHANTSFKIGTTSINLIQGDITKIKGYDAIVNAANTYLSHGGGVALAISKAAGPKLQEYSFAMPSMGEGMGEKLQVGQAVVTPAFNLEKNGIKWIIHAVGPQIKSGKPTKRDQKLLYDAYFNSLLQAKAVGAKKIAFPSISTAIFGYDVRLATPVAKEAVTDFITKYPDTLEAVAFVLFLPKDYPVFEQVFVPSTTATKIPVAKSFWQRFIDFVSNFFGWKQS